ncbi:polyketide cyclase [Flavobacterium sediminis]|uniref:Polyketide cyclase n=2 Tax=Flavobacterium sediminis TaxID=2201181 RepID=A0A2U8QYQ4_9FLAO|nr:polyketide cyclase [Flavobacterium sediminis]
MVSCSDNKQIEEKYQTEIQTLTSQLEKLAKENEEVAKNLKTFDTLDFVVYSTQEWKRLHESHADDILVHYPDGHTTVGIEDHIKELAPMFVFAPDTRIEQHPIKLGSGTMTAVVGELLGTFTEPMPIGNGKFIPPTGKAFKLPMCTVGLWNDKGVMYEEYLFWDNQAFLKQIGLAE